MAATPTLQQLLADVPPDVLSLKIQSDIHLAELAQHLTKWEDLVAYLGLKEIDQEDIIMNNRRAEQQR